MGHRGRHGTFRGSLYLTGGVSGLRRALPGDRSGTTVNGKADFTIVDANQIAIGITPDGGTIQHYDSVRVGGSAQTETVPQPAPGAAETVQSPDEFPPTADTASVGVSRSSGDLCGDAVAAQGNSQTKKQLIKGLGDVFAWSWLTVDFHDPMGKVIAYSPDEQSRACLTLADVIGVNAVLPRAANHGCRELALPIEVRTTKGKIPSIGKAKHAKLTESSVRYTFSASLGTITIEGNKSLRKSPGTRLHLAVVRARKAPPAFGTLKPTFGW